MSGYDLVATLDAIDPAALSYADWLRCGFALHAEGYDVGTFDRWSQLDPTRYHADVIERKWRSFGVSSEGVTGGSLVAIAREQGVEPVRSEGYELDWSDTIGGHRLEPVRKPTTRQAVAPALRPNEQTAEYLAALFGPDEMVCLSADVAGQGTHHRAGALVEALRRGEAPADLIDGYDPAAGAWCVVNPTNGRGRKRDDLTAWRYVLVESDDMPEADQLKLVTRMELPCAAVVSSAGKSIHAVVRVDAASAEEHAARACDLFAWCKRHGLDVDDATKNPTRFTRLPGVTRGDRMQELIAVDTGCASYSAWLSRRSRIESKLRAGALPPDITARELMRNPPEVPRELVGGIFRQGEKVILTGASKVGKTLVVMGLGVGVAEGRGWLEWPCARGPVYYINYEIQAGSFALRLSNVYRALGWTPVHDDDLHVLNLRGFAGDIGKIVDELVARVDAIQPCMIVFDPLYKMNIGDENSAQDTAVLTRHIDAIATRSGAAVVIVHHHPKGAMGGRTAMDRGSGSGVVARDADALIDLMDLDKKPEACERLAERMYRELLADVLPDMPEDLARDDMRSQAVHALGHGTAEANRLVGELDYLDVRIGRAVPVEVSTTLRDFPPGAPRRFWFLYPTLVPAGDELAGAKAEGFKPTPKAPEDYQADTLAAFEAVAIDGETTVKAIGEYLEVSEEWTRKRVDKAGLKRDRGKVTQ